MDRVLRDQAHRLKIKKSKAAAVGNLRAVKHYDLLLKALMVKNGTIYDPAALQVKPSRLAQQNMLKRRADGQAKVAQYKVPPWFRPGYDNHLRVRLWLRLAPPFRKGLEKQHRKGLLPEYYPSPSWWARKLKPSDFYTKPAKEEVIEAIMQEDPTVLEEESPEVVVPVMEIAEDQLLDLVDEATVLAAEASEEEAVLETLEQPGEGKLIAEQPWYDDPNKVLMAGVAGLIVLSVLK